MTRRKTKGGLKFDINKDRWDLLPWIEVREVARVLTFGAKKYGDYNWTAVENGRSRYLAAAMRHITAWIDGEIFDKESGLHHLAHGITCLLFLMWLDRIKGGRCGMDCTDSTDMVGSEAAPEISAERR